ncbi:MAG: DUF4129 domain-containing protein [Planctomycetes bacterium]|nr:DUF4129 domain-containing protein [Planctomycetota bacterium]
MREDAREERGAIGPDVARGIARAALIALSALAYASLSPEVVRIDTAILIASAALGLFVVRFPEDVREFFVFRNASALSPAIALYTMCALFGMLVLSRLLIVPLAFGLLLIRSPLAATGVLAGAFLAIGRGLADSPDFLISAGAIALAVIALVAGNRAEAPAGARASAPEIPIAGIAIAAGVGAGIILYLVLPKPVRVATAVAESGTGRVEVTAADAALSLSALAGGLLLVLLLLRLYGRMRDTAAAAADAEAIAATAGEERPIARTARRTRPWDEPRWKAVAAYLRLREHLDRRGIRFRRDQDAREAARILCDRIGDDARAPIGEVTRRFERARYGAGPVAEEEARRIEEAAEEVRRMAGEP